MKPLIADLSSSKGSRTSDANQHVADHLAKHPARIGEIVDGLSSSDTKLVADCAETLMMVAEHDPAIVAPYADDLANVIRKHKAKARWEATHAISLIADRAPKTVAKLLPLFHDLLAEDPSVIVRDYIVESLGNY